jgi:hypothetical protein
VTNAEDLRRAHRERARQEQGRAGGPEVNRRALLRSAAGAAALSSAPVLAAGPTPQVAHSLQDAVANGIATTPDGPVCADRRRLRA